LTNIRPPTAIDFGRLLLVSAIWGTSFICITVALVHFSPLAIAAWRVSLATVLVAVICVFRKVRLPRDKTSWALFAGIGLMNSAVPFTLHFLTTDDKINRYKVIGLLLGFAGVLVLIGRDAVVAQGSTFGMFIILFAAFCYSLSSLLIRRLAHLRTFAIVLGSLICGAAVLIPALLWFDPPWQQTGSQNAWLAVLFLATGPTAIAYLLRAEIVKINGAVFMSNAGYLIPLFAVFWAWLLLDEWPATATWLSMALILSGVAIGRYRGRYTALKPSA